MVPLVLQGGSNGSTGSNGSNGSNGCNGSTGIINSLCIAILYCSYLPSRVLGQGNFSDIYKLFMKSVKVLSIKSMKSLCNH